MLTVLHGSVAGLLHVVQGPDHLAALAPLTLQSRRRGALAGFWWGVGHGLGVLVLGTIGFVLHATLDLHVVSVYAELFVGILLVAVGVMALLRVSRSSGSVSAVVAETGQPPRFRSGAFGFGVLHGAAGVGHLFGVLTPLALSPGESAVWLGLYLCSAVAAMTLFGLGMGHMAGRVESRTLRGLQWVTGTLAVVVGSAWIATALAP